MKLTSFTYFVISLLTGFLLLQAFTTTNAEFTWGPVHSVQVQDTTASFDCGYEGTDDVIWKVNNTSLFINPRELIRTRILGNRHVLFITAIADYNGTVVQCCTYSSGEATETASLLVQGPLDSVTTSLQFNEELTSTTSIHFSWEAPFSLNLTRVEPDIEYCVDVYNITGEDTETFVNSVCVTTAHYTFLPDAPSPDHLFTFTVTPRSSVPDSVNGTRSEPILGYVFQAPSRIPTELISYETDSDLSSILWQFPLEVFGSTPGRLPTKYSIQVHSVDHPLLGSSSCNCLATSRIVKKKIVLSLQWCSNCHVERHRLYNYRIIAMNGAGTSTSEPTELSTHDVQHLMYRRGPLSDFDISVACNYLPGSTATGFFAVVSSLTNQSDIFYIVADRLSAQSQASCRVQNKEAYNVFVYDRGEDHLPEIWPAGMQIIPLINTDGNLSSDPLRETPRSKLHPQLSVTDGLICVNCCCAEPSVYACVVIIHSTHNTSNLLGKQLKVYSINTSVVYDCLRVDEDEYHVAVFGLLNTGLERVPAVKRFVKIQKIFTTVIPNRTTIAHPHPSTSIIVGIISVFLALVLCIAVTVIVIVAILVWRRTRKGNKELHEMVETDCEMTFPGIEQPNEAYNFVKNFKRNTAYQPHTVHHMQGTSQTEMERHMENHQTEPSSSPVVAADTNLVHIYDEAILLSADGHNQATEVIYAEIPVNREQ